MTGGFHRRLGMMNTTYEDYLRQGWQAGMRYAVASPENARAGFAGARLANLPGSSLEFMDHREYQPGDDLRRVDWSAFARTDRLTVRLYRQEVNPHVDVLVDGSRSMALEGTAKAEATIGLAALLATAAENVGFTHGTWLAAESWQPLANGTKSPDCWGPMDFDYAGNPSQSFEVLPPSLAPRGIRFFLSDLLWLGDPLALLARLAEKAAAVVVVQVLADADANPTQRGNLRLVDVETSAEREVFVDAVAERRYRTALARHQQNWNRAARQAGALMTTIVAERLIEGWELEDLVAAGVLKVGRQ